MWLALCQPTVARAYFNDVDEDFFRVGDDIADQGAQRSYSDLTEYEGFAPGVVRRVVDRVSGARRTLIIAGVIAGVFLAGTVVGFTIARVSGEAETPAAVAVPAPAPVSQPVAAPAIQPVAAPAVSPAVAEPAAAPVAAKPATQTAAKRTTRTAKRPTKRTASRGTPRLQPRGSASDPVFPY